MRTILQRAGFEVTKEVGATFAVVKTRIKFNPRWPGLAYEIIYVCKKVGEPQNYTTIDGKMGEEKIPTPLF